MEYAIESAALFNPSMVPAIDQTNVAPGAVRFVMSLRATGEGHVSSIVFRRGLIDANGNVSVDPPSRYSRSLRASVPVDFAKADFIRNYNRSTHGPNMPRLRLALLGDRFTRTELSEAIDKIRSRSDISGVSEESNEALLALSQANYRLVFPAAQTSPRLSSSRIPTTNGAALRICDLSDSQTMTGCFIITAPIRRTTGFKSSRISWSTRSKTRRDSHAHRALCEEQGAWPCFPERFAADTRWSRAWTTKTSTTWSRIMCASGMTPASCLTPKYPWEVIQIGNCGPPIETEAGWLLLTHGVGPMRQYCIGATLLDLENPCRVIGQTSEPLLVPTETERFGYVPNVVYSCGGMIHQGTLVLPYAASDVATSIAVIDLRELLDALEPRAGGR
jgi:hypothetical protein